MVFITHGMWFWGTNIHPGHVHWLVHTDIDLSKQLIQPGQNILVRGWWKLLEDRRQDGKDVWKEEVCRE
jgi:hypothetical protein